KAWFHRAPVTVPRHGHASLRRLHVASVLRVRRHRLWSERSRLLWTTGEPAVRDSLSLRPWTRTTVPRSPQGPLRCDWRARQSISTAYAAAAGHRTTDVARRRARGEERHLARDGARE